MPNKETTILFNVEAFEVLKLCIDKELKMRAYLNKLSKTNF
jgi:hypothetical protein